MRKGRDRGEKKRGKKNGKKNGKNGKKEKKKKIRMKIVATTSLPVVDRPNADRWNATRLCQNFKSAYFLFKSSRSSIPQFL